jgi:hypothetical protein
MIVTCRYSVLRVKPSTREQVNYLASMEDDHFEFWTEPGLNRYQCTVFIFIDQNGFLMILHGKI